VSAGPPRAPRRDTRRDGGDGDWLPAARARGRRDGARGGQDARTPAGLFVALVVALGVGLVGVAGGLTRGQDAPGPPAAVAPPVAAAAGPRPPAAPAPTPPAPSPSPSPSPTPTPDPADAPLADRLAGLLAEPDAAGVAVAVLDDGGARVFGARADEPLLPASTMKLVAAAGALAALGPDHRFATTSEAAGELGADGTLTGDLVLRGGGDPVLATPLFADQVEPDRPETRLDALADQIVAAGVRRVTGRVLGEAGAWADQPLPSGWTEEYLASFDGVRSTALTVDAGRELVNRDGRVVALPAVDPPATAANQLRVLLAERGVAVDGGAASARGTPPGRGLGTVTSPPLRDLLAFVVQASDNQVADMVFRAVGAATGDPTWAGSAAGTRSALAVLDLDWTGVVAADGSGLSRDDRVPAAFLAALDRGVSRSDAAAEWEALMAVSGRSGTLRRRLVGTVAEGRLRGKTGTLSDVRSLSGAVVGPDGRRTYVTVIANDLTPDRIEGVRRITDEVVLAVAEHRYGCARLPPALPPEPGQLPYELSCPPTG